MWSIIILFALVSIVTVTNAGRLVLEAPDPADLAAADHGDEVATDISDQPTKLVRFTTHQVIHH
jgi:hypothetical protein